MASLPVASLHSSWTHHSSWNHRPGDLSGSCPAHMTAWSKMQLGWLTPVEVVVQPGAFSYSSPTIADGVLFVGNLDSHLYALNAKNGTLRWRFQTGTEVTSSPVAAGGVVYFGGQDKLLYALDAKTGKLKWKFATEGKVMSAIRLHEGNLYFGSFDHHFYVFQLLLDVGWQAIQGFSHERLKGFPALRAARFAYDHRLFYQHLVICWNDLNPRIASFEWNGLTVGKDKFRCLVSIGPPKSLNNHPITKDLCPPFAIDNDPDRGRTVAVFHNFRWQVFSIIHDHIGSRKLLVIGKIKHRFATDPA